MARGGRRLRRLERRDRPRAKRKRRSLLKKNNHPPRTPTTDSASAAGDSFTFPFDDERLIVRK
jgi:hypothetical protein